MPFRSFSLLTFVPMDESIDVRASLIQILPDAVANQIAAGEVVQKEAADD